MSIKYENLNRTLERLKANISETEKSAIRVDEIVSFVEEDIYEYVRLEVSKRIESVIEDTEHYQTRLAFEWLVFELDKRERTLERMSLVNQALILKDK